LGQVAVNVEVIVVDDGSSPPVTATQPPLGSPHVRVIRHDEPRGDAAARNSGVKAAQGRWVSFLDDDDLWGPRKLEEQLLALARRTGAVYAYCGAVELDAEGRVIRDLPPPNPDELPALLATRNVMPAGSSNVLVRTDVMRLIGGFDERFRNLSDWDLWLRLAGIGPGARSEQRLVAYRRHRGSGCGSTRTALTDHSALVDTAGLIGQLHELQRKHRESPLALRPDWIDYTRWLVAAGPRRAGRRFAAAWLYLRFGVRQRSAGTLARGTAMLLGERVIGRLGAKRGATPATPEWLKKDHDASSGMT
jgi:glycosyltransferase involved in cell wall biosynthesis